MVRRFALLTAIVGSSIAVIAAPDTVRVGGVVVDSNGNPVVSATIAMERQSETLSETVGQGLRLEIIARAVTDKEGRFSFGEVDPAAKPKGLRPDEVVTKIDPHARYHVGAGNQERTVTSVEVTTEPGKNNVAPSVQLKVTVK